MSAIELALARSKELARALRRMQKRGTVGNRLAAREAALAAQEAAIAAARGAP